jgi:hypothetical protein
VYHTYALNYLRFSLPTTWLGGGGGGSVGGIMILLFLYYMGSAPAIVYKIPHVDT